MKKQQRLALVFTTALSLAIGAEAISFYWDGGTANIVENGDGVSAGGAGTWNAAIQNWDQGSGSAHVAWNSASTAVLGGTAGTVTLGANTTAAGITLQSTGYTISGAGTSGYALTAGALDLGVNDLSITTKSANGSFNLSSLSGSGNLTLNNGTYSMTLSSLATADALNFNGTLTLRGGGASTAPGTLAANWLKLGGTGVSQASGTSFALDTGASTSNAKDLILSAEDWGGKTLTLSSLTGYGAIRSDWGNTADACKTVMVNQAGTTTFNGMILSHGTASYSRKIALQKDGAGQLTLAGIVGLQTTSASGTLANHTVTVDVKGGTLVMTANNTTTGTLNVRTNATLKMQNTTAGASLSFTAGNTSMTGNYTVDAGGKLQGFSNGTSAFGTGSIILNGGTLAQEQGNWAWANNIILNSDTTSTLENQSSNTGTRSLKIQGVLSGGGNLGFSDTTDGMGLDTGFIFTGANTLSGTVTIASGRKLRVGGLPGNDSSLNAGTGGTLGTATVVNNGTLTFSRSDTHTVSNAISGSGVVRIGSTGITGSGTQDITLAGNNSYSGGTAINAGILRLGHSTDTLADTGAVTVSAATLDIGANSDTVGPVTLTNGASITGTTGLLSGSAYAFASGTASARLGGNGTLTKISADTVTLSGANTYSGGTAIEGGTLVVNGSLGDGSSVALASGAALRGTGTIGGAVTVANGTAVLTGGDGTSGVLTISDLTFDGAATVTVGPLANYTDNKVIDVTGTLTFNGGANKVTLNLPTAPASSGTYHLIGHGNSLGDLSGVQLGTTPALSSRQSGALVNNAGCIDYVISGVNPYWTGAQSSEWSTNTLAPPKNWALPGGATADYIEGDSVLFDDAATGTSVDLAAEVSPVAVIFNNVSKSYVLTGSAGIAGATGLTKSGAGALTLSSTNSYSGGTTISGGTVTLGHDSALGSGPVGLNGGTLDINGRSIANAIALGGGTLSGDGTLAGNISGSGFLTKSTGGTLTLSGNNSYGGVTTLDAGILAISSANSLGTSTVAIAGSSTLLVNNTFTNSNSATIGSGVTATIDTNGKNLTHNGSISGSNGSLTKAGEGTLTLTSANPYSGSTAVNAGTLKFTGAGTTGSSAAEIAAGATFEWGRDAACGVAFSGTGTIARTTTSGNAPFSGGNSAFRGSWLVTAGYVGLVSDSTVGSAGVGMTLNGGGIYFSSSGNTLADTRTITLGAAGGTLNGSTGNINTYAAKFTGIGGLSKVSGEKSILTATNDYAGNTSVNTGTLEIGGAGVIGNGSYTGTVSLAATLSINTTEPQTLAGALSGGGALTKSNVGTLTLTATNSYTGNTTVSGGLLDLSGGILYSGGYNNTAVVTVNTGAKLKLKSYRYDANTSLGMLSDYAARRVINGGTLEVTAGTESSGNDFTIGTSGGTFRYAPANTNDTLSFTGATADDITLNGALTFDAVGNIAVGEIMKNGTGSGSLIKTGAGTLTLAAANSFTGTTTVSNGVLLVNSTHPEAGAYIVVTNAAFGGTGTVTVASGTVTVEDGATLVPGPAAQEGGTLTLSALTMAPTATLAIDATNDAVVVTGSLILDNTRVSLANAQLFNKTVKYPILTCGGSLSGTLASPVDAAHWLVRKLGSTFYLQYNSGTVILIH